MDDSRAPQTRQSHDAEQSLAAFWQRLARRATDAQLAACAAVFPVIMILALVVMFARPHWVARWWPIIGAPLLVGSFGLWGIADRERDSANRALWRIVQSLSVVVAVASAIVFTLWFLQRVVGTWNL
jgi:hypothetical protein